VPAPPPPLSPLPAANQSPMSLLAPQDFHQAGLHNSLPGLSLDDSGMCHYHLVLCVTLHSSVSLLPCTACHLVLCVTLYSVSLSPCTVCHLAQCVTLHSVSPCTLCHLVLCVTLYSVSPCTVCHLVLCVLPCTVWHITFYNVPLLSCTVCHLVQCVKCDLDLVV